MGKSTISMAIFNSYVSSPEAISTLYGHGVMASPHIDGVGIPPPFRRSGPGTSSWLQNEAPK